MPPNTHYPCPCGTGLTYRECCQSYIAGHQLPLTAESLMRSRYSAHVSGDIDYLMATWLPAQRRHIDPTQVADWAAQSQWLRLQVVNTEAGQQDDSEGWVEFIATYRQGGGLCVHHERSYFSRRTDRWYFVEGAIMEPSPKRTAGRNHPCPCGSGKKYKRCCG